MLAPFSKSIPFLIISRHHKIDYGTILLWADWYQKGRHDPNQPQRHWHDMARAKLENSIKGRMAIQDILETVDILENAGATATA